MKKTHLIGVLGVLTALVTCPVQADQTRDDTQAKLKLSDAKQDEEQSKKSSSPTPIVSNAEEKSVDCFYLENVTDPLCKK